ncbi:hypothetical protein [Luteolibacter soli]|uniref:Lipoprotein n=1 Tax=Luteolibacter soli TaxID=3135280 RepID=A0ABU9AQD4_9BACT
MKQLVHRILGSLALMVGVFAIASCASMGSSSAEPLLSAAGFVSRTPENAKQQELYNQLPAYQLHRASYKGQVIYAYKDEKKGLAYVGNEAAYQHYQQLATQQRIANDYRMAAEMNQEAAYGWYGAYGPYIGYRPVVVHRR